MPPQHLEFGGGSVDTVLLPIVAVLLALTVGLVLALRRKYLVVPFLLCAFLIPQGQTVVIGGVHFFVLRIVLIFLWIRLLVRKVAFSQHLLKNPWSKLDNIFCVWAVYHVLAFLVVFGIQPATITNQLGVLLDLFGVYFLLRHLVQDVSDIQRIVRVLATITIIIGPSMIYEKLHGTNLFGYLGASFTPDVREGAIRAQGPFAHAILAGTFGATLLPLLLSLRTTSKARVLPIAAIASSLAMMLSCASSTPLMALGGGIIGLCFWPFRHHVRQIRWGLAIGLVVLHLAMKAPVWFLIERVSIVGGSSGYHRAMLVDQFIRHFWDWAFFGTNQNASWGNDMWDLSNQFVAEGESGGLPVFICFIWMISFCFSRIGKSLRRTPCNREHEWYLWLLGCTLLAHIVGFFGISYFDHTEVAWLALLVIIDTATRRPVADMLTAKAPKSRLVENAADDIFVDSEIRAKVSIASEPF